MHIGHPNFIIYNKLILQRLLERIFIFMSVVGYIEILELNYFNNCNNLCTKDFKKTHGI